VTSAEPRRGRAPRGLRGRRAVAASGVGAALALAGCATGPGNAAGLSAAEYLHGAPACRAQSPAEVADRLRPWFSACFRPAMVPDICGHTNRSGRSQLRDCERLEDRAWAEEAIPGGVRLAGRVRAQVSHAETYKLSAEVVAGRSPCNTEVRLHAADGAWARRFGALLDASTGGEIRCEAAGAPPDTLP
jgi:hypothetical protein